MPGDHEPAVRKPSGEIRPELIRKLADEHAEIVLREAPDTESSGYDEQAVRKV